MGPGGNAPPGRTFPPCGGTRTSGSGGARVARHDPKPSCAQCASFTDEPHELERIFAGMTALSSAYGSTRGRAGVCAVSERFHDPQPACGEFAPRAVATAAESAGR